MFDHCAVDLLYNIIKEKYNTKFQICRHHSIILLRLTHKCGLLQNVKDFTWTNSSTRGQSWALSFTKKNSDRVNGRTTMLDCDCSLSEGKCIIDTWFQRQTSSNRHKGSISIWHNTHTRCSSRSQNSSSCNASAWYNCERVQDVKNLAITKIILLYNNGYGIVKLINYSVCPQAGQGDRVHELSYQV